VSDSVKTRVLAIAALTGVVLGFSNTSPVIAWSSTSSITLNSLPSRLEDVNDTLAIVHSLVDTDEICEYDAVIVVEQPGLHASDLRSLSPKSGLFKRVNSAPSARQYPYVHAHPEVDALTLARKVSSNCRSRLSQVTLDNVPSSFEHPSEKHVLAIIMPDLSESGKVRKAAMASHESLLSQTLEVSATEFTNHLVIFVGSPLSTLSGNFKRQEPIPSVVRSSDYSNTRLSASGVLNKYQLLTPELITSLLVSFFIILPIAFYGLKALASIQNPISMDTTKSSFYALEKKNQ